MAYIIEPINIAEYWIYVILFPETSEFFVSKTTSKNLRETYRNHYYGGSPRTKTRFERVKKGETTAKMFALENLKCAKDKADSYCVAWVRYFRDHGWTSLCGEKFDSYSGDLYEETAALYDEICCRSIDEICRAEEDFILIYGREKRKKRCGKTVVSFDTTDEEHGLIRKLAKENGVTMSQYCKKMAMGKPILEYNPELERAFQELDSQFSKMISTLKSLHLAWAKSGFYRVEDLCDLSDFILSAQEEHKKSLQRRNKIKETMS